MNEEKQALLEKILNLGDEAKIDNQKTRTFGGGGHLPEKGIFEIREESVYVDEENSSFNHYRLFVEGYPIEYSISLSSLINNFYHGDVEDATFAQGKKDASKVYLIGNTPGCIGRPLPGNANNKKLLQFFDGMKFVKVKEFKTLTLPFDTEGTVSTEEGKNALRELLKAGSKLQVELDPFKP